MHEAPERAAAAAAAIATRVGLRQPAARAASSAPPAARAASSTPPAARAASSAPPAARPANSAPPAARPASSTTPAARAASSAPPATPTSGGSRSSSRTAAGAASSSGGGGQQAAAGAAPPGGQARACAACGKAAGAGGAKLKACSGCRGLLDVRYCSVSRAGMERSSVGGHRWGAAWGRTLHCMSHGGAAAVGAGSQEGARRPLCRYQVPAPANRCLMPYLPFPLPFHHVQTACQAADWSAGHAADCKRARQQRPAATAQPSGQQRPDAGRASAVPASSGQSQSQSLRTAMRQ
jgi:hypothetical protein